ncbi:transposase [Paraburkholderia sp. MMS20-SJTN17]|uniref:Transposase n=1 Tax=Paraburkholderia translucens TaxID=2886945 RepID=A0ABS8KJK8_9BURK|nr:transposase [Paraburkholderia sp. MMS20-SJTN17]MCC8404955.1 transposase [Paraburkholderia sp. MMS20-SJTN17]
MFFDELNNDEWALLAPLVSDEPAVRLNRRGRPRAEPRIVTNAVLWILTTGEPWSKLPGRYPSGPTCRRRFEEWQLNGTLLEMVRLLSQRGRTFAYIPQPAPPVTARPAAPVAQTPSPREDNSLRGVSWKSPESWQAPGGASALSQWRTADPIADITRQLSGLHHAGAAHAGAAHAGAPHAASAPAASAAEAVTHTEAAAGQGDTTSVTDVMPPAPDALGAASAPVSAGEPRPSLSMVLAPRGMQVADSRGYLIYVVVEEVPGAMYRAWAEIMRDGKRVERSGLIGPRFADAQHAQQFALDWGRQWIDRESATDAAATTLTHASAESASAPVSVNPAQRAAGRLLPGSPHVPEPPSGKSMANYTGNHGAPLHAPLNSSSHALRAPVRRYPSDAGSAGVASPPAVTTESSATERFSAAYKELISYVG